MKPRTTRSLVLLLPFFAVACASAPDAPAPDDTSATPSNDEANAAGASSAELDDRIPASALGDEATLEFEPSLDSEYDDVAPDVAYPDQADDVTLFQDAPAPGDLDVHEGDFAAQGPQIDLGEGVTTESLSRAQRALNWYARHRGSHAWEGWCLKAAANSYGRPAAGFPTAYSLWVNRVHRGVAHHNMRPPKGALVFWKTSKFGHVGVADGSGGFWSSSVHSAIGHAKLPYFRNYLGWAPKPW